jgi:hypothetical protein
MQPLGGNLWEGSRLFIDLDTIKFGPSSIPCNQQRFSFLLGDLINPAEFDSS